CVTNQSTVHAARRRQGGVDARREDRRVDGTDHHTARIPPDAAGMKIEVSFQSTGRLLAQDVTEVGTYWSTPRPGGAMYGEGQGILTLKNGEICTWQGSGIGKPKANGPGIIFRGCVYYQTNSAQLSRLNGTCAVFEYEADENGNTKSQLWEWR